MDWIDLAQPREQWRTLVNTVMNLEDQRATMMDILSENSKKKKTKIRCRALKARRKKDLCKMSVTS
jgi:hypothetical protein